MTCPHCGAESTFGLRFCKHCGGSIPGLTPPAGASPPPYRLTGAAWAIALAATVITLAGLGIVFSHVFDLMMPPGLPPLPPGYSDPKPVAILMLIFGTAAVVGVVTMLIRLFTRLLSLPPAEQPHRPEVIREPGYVPPQLGESRPSVTEHTTRNFEPVARESKGNFEPR